MKRGAWTLLILLALGSSPVMACPCSQLPLQDYFQHAGWVALIRVEALLDIHQADGPAVQPVAIRVLETYKGSARPARLYTPASTASCGMLLLPGSDYWVFARHWEPGADMWWIDTCSGSRPVGADFMHVDGESVTTVLRSLKGETPEVGENPRRRITLGTIGPDHVDAQLVEHFARQALVSPNGAWRFVVLEPPAIARPPRVPRIVVEREQGTMLELSLNGASGIEQAAWVNEKLVLVQVVWEAGRQSALLLDVQQGHILYGGD